MSFSVENSTEHIVILKGSNCVSFSCNATFILQHDSYLSDKSYVPVLNFSPMHTVITYSFFFNVCIWPYVLRFAFIFM